MTTTFAVAFALASIPSQGFAQSSKDITLHVNPRWKECSFQIDHSLTQRAWRQFTHEAGLVAYFRPLADAKPMRRGQFEFSVLQWETGIDDTDAAWNDTFVHPDSTHWLLEGNGLAFPGLSLRAGATDKLDVGAYFTKNPNANYGFYGGQVQYNFAQGANKDWAASARMSFASLFGPEDLDFAVYGLDLLASKEVSATKWASVSPYAGVSTYLSRSHEKTSVVNLSDENVLGAQAMVGAVVRVSRIRLGVEYNTAKVNSTSMKVGVAF